MRKSAITTIHIGYWVAYLLLWLLVIGGISQSDDFTQEDTKFYAGVIVGIAIIPGIYSFYTFYFFLFPRYLSKKKITESIIVAIVIALSAWLISVVTLRFSANMALSCHAESNYFSILIAAFIALVNGVIALIIRGFITWYQEIKIKEELQQKNHEMELALLKSKLDPHFLFNTLNNIDIMMLKDPKEASGYLNGLSDIMRFMLFETKSELIPLEREIEYINKYIDLQKIRTSNDQYVTFEVIGDPTGRMIAPMVFIPFIENAFKHTNNKKIKNAIDIRIEIDKSQIKLLCENKVDPSRITSVESNGLGNELISKRLKLIYPNMHSLAVNHHDHHYNISLTLDHEPA
ncbi:sensor histidine kinase [Portibacter lacus]|uniref:Signal transduction histidine kinase internal region domain-containing protein n=1 Tax=Portibacter lacus TaxID=1099794 RepID=A0AA37STN4_9BACT|nr:histidine kinase [Portibacter lacus]GLR18018.1 hypothetical protein GCM10007940_26330 [Portibacter lacus]